MLIIYTGYCLDKFVNKNDPEVWHPNVYEAEDVQALTGRNLLLRSIRSKKDLLVASNSETLFLAARLEAIQQEVEFAVCTVEPLGLCRKFLFDVRGNTSLWSTELFGYNEKLISEILRVRSNKYRTV